MNGVWRLRTLRLILTLLLLGGCMTKERGPAVKTVPFAVRETTFRDVISQWGNPDSIKGTEAIWKTTKSNGGKIKASYMMVGVTLSSARLATREYRLRFDEKGVLTEIRICDSTPDGTPWTILPWF